jgi:hypothetical protein
LHYLQLISGEYYKPLNKNNIIKRKGPVVLVIMDGMGIGKENEGNAFFLARTPNLDRLMNSCPYTTLKAHGTAVDCPVMLTWGILKWGTMLLAPGGFLIRVPSSFQMLLILARFLPLLSGRALLISL